MILIKLLKEKDFPKNNLVKLDNADVGIEISFPENNWKTIS